MVRRKPFALMLCAHAHTHTHVNGIYLGVLMWWPYSHWNLKYWFILTTLTLSIKYRVTCHACDAHLKRQCIKWTLHLLERSNNGNVFLYYVKQNAGNGLIQHCRLAQIGNTPANGLFIVEHCLIHWANNKLAYFNCACAIKVNMWNYTINVHGFLYYIYNNIHLFDNIFILILYSFKYKDNYIFKCKDN